MVSQMLDLRDAASARLHSLSKVEIFGGLICVYLVYQLFSAFYQIFFHPLSRFPGSKWAAVSRWYQFYWNVIHRGSLLFEAERLHKKHGPFVRTGPNELSVNVPEYHHEIFRVGSKYVKEKYHYDLFCMPKASTGIRDPREIRIRREALKPLFERRVIMDRAPAIRKKMDQLCRKLAEMKTVVLQDALSSFTLDVITQFTFSEDFDAVGYPNFEHPYLTVLHASIENSWVSKLIPSIRIAAMSIEPYFRKALAQTPTMRLLASVRVAIDNYLEKRDAMKLPEIRFNAVDHLMSPNAARSYVVPDIETLNMEILGVVGGGTETTATAATVGIYQILTKPQVRKRLVDELTAAFPDPKAEIGWHEFEKLPYLAAVVKETFRYASPVPGGTPRIVPEGGAVVDGTFIPAGTVVMCGAYLTHRNEALYPNGHEFIPERWLQESKPADRYFLTFSKGIGQCPGMNLAWAELYTILGTLFLNFDMELAPGTSPEQMEWTDNVVVVLNGPKLKVVFTPK